MTQMQQSDRVRELRAHGLAPKQIARTLGLRPAEVIAVLSQSVTDSSRAGEKAPVVRCWVNSGWATKSR